MFLFPEESEELPQSFWDCEQHLADLHGPHCLKARKRGVDMERIISGKVASIVDIDKDRGSPRAATA
jgi:hypothetical protein